MLIDGSRYSPPRFQGLPFTRVRTHTYARTCTDPHSVSRAGLHRPHHGPCLCRHSACVQDGGGAPVGTGSRLAQRQPPEKRGGGCPWRSSPPGVLRSGGGGWRPSPWVAATSLLMGSAKPPPPAVVTAAGPLYPVSKGATRCLWGRGAGNGVSRGDERQLGLSL